jgi:hypothetical protein
VAASPATASSAGAAPGSTNAPSEALTPTPPAPAVERR